ncbi:hypothetical protein DD788_26970, partial [Ralstonia pickettii]|nr:hypothetical protein [Ralstonia pickettii]
KVGFRRKNRYLKSKMRCRKRPAKTLELSLSAMLEQTIRRWLLMRTVSLATLSEKNIAGSHGVQTIAEHLLPTRLNLEWNRKDENIFGIYYIGINFNVLSICIFVD